MLRIVLLAALGLSTNALILHGAAEPADASKAAVPAAKVAAKKAPEQQRMRVMSDFHLGGCWAGHKDTREKLMKFLEEMADPASDANEGTPITQLVLLGDVWDWWLIPIDEKIPAPEELFLETKSHGGYDIPKFIQLIKDIGKRMKIYLIRGNHDDISSVELTKKAFGDSVQFMEDGMELNGVWMEHGNIYDMYSVPVVRPGAPKKQGFSYFVTRTQAMADSGGCKTAVAEGRDGPFHDAMARAINDQTHLMEQFDKPDFAVNPKIFAPKYLETLVQNMGENWRDVKVTGMKEDGISFNYNTMESNYTLGDAVRDHAEDGAKMIEKFGTRGALSRIVATSMDNARMFSRSNRKHLVFISGHSHMPYVERVQRDKKSKVSAELVYANSGAWTFDTYGRHLHSYVDVTFDKVEDDSIPSLEAGSWRPSVVKYFEYPETEARESVQVPIPKSNKFYGWETDMHPDKEEMILGSGADGIRLLHPSAYIQ